MLAAMARVSRYSDGTVSRDEQGHKEVRLHSKGVNK